MKKQNLYGELLATLTPAQRAPIDNAARALHRAEEQLSAVKHDLNAVNSDLRLADGIQITAVKFAAINALRKEKVQLEAELKNIVNGVRLAKAGHNKTVETVCKKYGMKAVQNEPSTRTVKTREGMSVELIPYGAFAVDMESAVELFGKLTRAISEMSKNPKLRMVLQFKSV